MNIKEDLYNMNKKTDFIEKKIKEEFTEREKAEQKKIKQYNLKMELQKHFYSYFKKHQGNTETDIIDFYDIETREKIIQQLGENDGEKMTYLNSIYSKTLKEISQIFKDNDKFIEGQKKVYTIDDLAGVYAWANEHNRKALKLKAKEDIKKANKHGFITFLNLILTPWGK